MGRLLAIDVGNTHGVVALCDSSRKRIEHRWRFASRIERTAEEYAAWLQSMFSLADLSPQGVDRIVLASVVPQLTAPLVQMGRLFLSLDADLVRGRDIPLETRLSNPDEVGVDRLINAFAAKEKYGAPALVVDFGTATTFDLLDAQECYIGGAIAPGIELSRDSLVSRTACLPAIDLCSHPEPFGKDTVSAMRAGFYWGWVSLVEGMCARLTCKLSETPGSVATIATGGFASLLKDDCPHLRCVDRDLTIEGLMRLPICARSASRSVSA